MFFQSSDWLFSLYLGFNIWFIKQNVTLLLVFCDCDLWLHAIFYFFSFHFYPFLDRSPTEKILNLRETNLVNLINSDYGGKNLGLYKFGFRRSDGSQFESWLWCSSGNEIGLSTHCGLAFLKVKTAVCRVACYIGRKGDQCFTGWLNWFFFLFYLNQTTTYNMKGVGCSNRHCQLKQPFGSPVPTLRYNP